MEKTAKVISVKRIGKVRCLDLEMKSRHHNFVCESLVTSNSHAVAYSFLTYQTAWLKKNYRKEFMASVMSHSQKDDEAKIKLPKCIMECRKYFKINCPDINYSTNRFTIHKGNLLFPLSAIKTVGEKAVDSVIEQQNVNKFKSFEDFFNRINKRVVNVGVITNIILSDAFRKFGTRQEIFDEFISLRSSDSVSRQMYCYDCRYRYPCAVKKDDTPMCPSCGSGSVSIDIDNCMGKDFNNSFCENNYVFGFNVKENPLKKYLKIMIKKKYNDFDTILEELDGDLIKTIATIVGIKKHIDKNDNEMAFIKLRDLHNVEADLCIFASDWEKFKSKIKEGKHYKMKLIKSGSLSYKGTDENSFLYDGRRQSFIKMLK